MIIMITIMIIVRIDGKRRVVVRQSIAGQCSNNSNDLHATLPKVVVIIIVILILIKIIIMMMIICTNYQRLIHCGKWKANFV